MRFVFPAETGGRASRSATASRTPGLSAPQPQGLRELLHWRLKYAFTISSFLTSVFLGSLAKVFSKADASGILALLPFLVVPAVLLWRKKKYSVKVLRRFDLLLLLIGFASILYISILRLTHLMWVPHPLPPIAEMAGVGRNVWVLFPEGLLLAQVSFPVLCNPLILLWGFLAVSYSVLIPNTWRRLAIIMGCILLAALFCVLYVAIRHPEFSFRLGAALAYTGSVVGGFAATGLYGAHKLETLRSEALAASQVGQYYLKRQLGKGGMGEVYLAEHRMLRRPCAVKLIRQEQAGDAGSLARFEREVQAMARLTHPNTVEIYDYGRSDDGTFYYAMEFLPGMSLEELYHTHGALPPGRAIYFLRQICGALHEAHTQGLIHRDLKPANIFVCERGGLHDVIKILDFGLVREVGVSELPPPPLDTADPAGPPISGSAKLTQAGHILGTPTYMSPEQICGEETDARSDIYSLGSVACCLLTGRPPYERDTVAELCSAHLSEAPPLLRERNPRIPAVLESAVLRCLAKNRDERFQSVQELEAALAACAAAATWDKERAAAWWSHQAQQKNSLATEPLAFDETQAGT